MKALFYKLFALFWGCFLAVLVQAEPERLKYSDLTPFEKAAFDAFFEQRRNYDSAPRSVDLAKYENDYDGENWKNGWRDDSLDRLIRFDPRIADLVRKGRENRFEHINQVVNVDAPMWFRRTQIKPYLPQLIAERYFELLSRYRVKKVIEPPWLGVQAEQIVRTKWQNVLRKAQLRDFPDSVGQFPVSKWPPEAQKALAREREKLVQTLPPNQSTSELPPKILMEWLRWAQNEVNVQNYFIEDSHYGRGQLDSAYQNNLRSILNSQQIKLIKFLDSSPELLDPSRRENFLSAFADESSREIRNADIDVFGPRDSRVGGIDNKLRDPKHAWLYDIAWAGKEIRDQLIAEGKEKRSHRRPPITRLLDPPLYWKNLRGFIAKAVTTVGILGAAALGTHELWSQRYSIRTYMRSVELNSGHTSVSSEEGSGPPIGIFSRFDPVSSSQDRQGETGNALVFTMNRLSLGIPEDVQLEMPNIEDLEKGTWALSSSKGSVLANISSKTSFIAHKGEFVAIPRILGLVPIVPDVFRDGKHLTEGKDFELIETQNGFHFIRLVQPDRLPLLSASRVKYTVGYALDSRKPQEPIQPTIANQEVRKGAIVVEDAGFDPLGKKIRDSARTDGDNSVTVSALEQTIKGHSYYRLYDAKKKKPWFDSNPISQFHQFKDPQGEFCADCDVTNDLLREIVQDRVNEKEKWDFEIRTSYTTKDGNNFTVAGGHGKLFGWKEGFKDPLIWDATPGQWYSDKEKSDFQSKQADPTTVEKPEESEEGTKEIVLPWFHRFRFSGDIELNSIEEGANPSEPPDWNDPKIRREIERAEREHDQASFKKKLLGTIDEGMKTQQIRNGHKEDSLKTLENSRNELLRAIENAKLSDFPDQTLPHKVALALSSRLKDLVQANHRDQIKDILAEIARISSYASTPFSGELSDLGPTLNRVKAKIEEEIKFAHERAKTSRNSRIDVALGRNIIGPTLRLLETMSSQGWSPKETLNRNDIRHHCYRELRQFGSGAKI